MPLIAADLLRAAALLGLVPAAVGDGAIGFSVMFLVLGGCMVPRALGLAARVDWLVCATLLVAGWAALLDWYAAVPGLDLVVHALTTGLVAVLVWECLTRLPWPAQAYRTLSPVGVAVAVTASTMVLAALWELGEWIGHTRLDSRIQVGAVDTATDLLAGLLGAAAVGAWAASAHAASRPATEGSAR